MQPNAPVPTPAPAPPSVPARPIQDVAPPHDSLGNPENLNTIPIRQAPDAQPAPANPIMAAGMPHPLPEAKPGKGDDLDKVLKDVNKDVKQSIHKPKAVSKPTIAITLAIIVGAILMAAAYSAFSSSN